MHCFVNMWLQHDWAVKHKRGSTYTENRSNFPIFHHRRQNLPFHWKPNINSPWQKKLKKEREISNTEESNITSKIKPPHSELSYDKFTDIMAIKFYNHNPQQIITNEWRCSGFPFLIKKIICFWISPWRHQKIQLCLLSGPWTLCLLSRDISAENMPSTMI